MSYQNNRNGNGYRNQNSQQGQRSGPPRRQGGGGYQGNNQRQNNGPKVNWRELRIGGLYYAKNDALIGKITLDGVDYRLVCFSNTMKQEGESTPDYYVHLQPEDGGDQNQQRQQSPSNQARRAQRPAPRNSPPVQETPYEPQNDGQQYEDPQQGGEADF